MMKMPQNLKKLPTAAQPLALTVMAPDDSDTAEMFVYGYIGEDWWSGSPNSAENVAQAIANLIASKKKRINMRIQSYGGEVFEGNAIISAMRRAAEAGIEVHTYNDGVACSMAAMIWACGTKRHMATNSLMMLHCASDWAWGNANDMRAAAAFLDSVDETLKATLVEKLGVSDADVAAYFDGPDHWLTFAQVRDLGWLTEETAEAVTDVEGAPASIPAAVATAQTLREKGLQKREAMKSVGATAYVSPIVSHEKVTDVTIDTLKAALAEGSLTTEAVRGAIAELETAPEPTPAPAAEPAPAENAELQELKAQLSKMEATLTALHGGGTRLPATTDPTPTVSPEDAADLAILKQVNAALQAQRPCW